MSMNADPVTRLQAAALADASGVQRFAGGAVAVSRGRVLAVGRLSDLPVGRTIDLGDVLLTPAHVNAHTHLELTSIGPRPYAGSFVEWVRMLQAERAAGHDAVYASVAEGCGGLADAGVGYVGDIGGGRHGQGALRGAMVDNQTQGVMFCEYLGLDGRPAEPQHERLQADLAAPAPPQGLRIGLQPHAPYSTGRGVYQACTQAAMRRGWPLSTHLAEMLQEHAFVGRATGPFRDFLEDLGLWTDALLDVYGKGLSPVQWMEPYLQQAPWLLAHGNYLSDDDIAILARHHASIAYCPIASAYFGHPQNGHPPHRYRDLLAAGVNVCLGTDSILCQPADEPQPMGVLPAMRYLHQRDGVDPALLLAMATTHGHRALQSPALQGTLAPGADARFTLIDLPPNHGSAAVDTLTLALQSDAPARLWDDTN
ncbi:MAG: amidohydrolase family protein [Planctomycetota bacterium]